MPGVGGCDGCDGVRRVEERARLQESMERRQLVDPESIDKQFWVDCLFVPTSSYWKSKVTAYDSAVQAASRHDEASTEEGAIGKTRLVLRCCKASGVLDAVPRGELRESQEGW